MIKKLTLMLLATVLATGAAMARDTRTRNVQDLPKGAQQTVKDKFKADISIIKIERGIAGIKEYDVVLTDGTEVTFDKNGNWEEVEVPNNKKVPDWFVPKATRQYIKQNFKGTNIVGIEKERNGYEVHLNNGLEIKFDAKGAFVRFNDD